MVRPTGRNTAGRVGSWRNGRSAVSVDHGGIVTRPPAWLPGWLGPGCHTRGRDSACGRTRTLVDVQDGHAPAAPGTANHGLDPAKPQAVRSSRSEVLNGNRLRFPTSWLEMESGDGANRLACSVSGARHAERVPWPSVTASSTLGPGNRHEQAAVNDGSHEASQGGKEGCTTEGEKRWRRWRLGHFLVECVLQRHRVHGWPWSSIHQGSGDRKTPCGTFRLASRPGRAYALVDDGRGLGAVTPAGGGDDLGGTVGVGGWIIQPWLSLRATWPAPTATSWTLVIHSRAAASKWCVATCHAGNSSPHEVV